VKHFARETFESRDEGGKFLGQGSRLFHDKIIAVYARGMMVRQTQGVLADQSGTEAPPDFISRVTDAVLAEATA
jgi:transposase-like protein